MSEFEIERWVSMNDICEHLGIKRESALKWIINKNMPAKKIGKLWKFKISEVDEWVNSGGAAEKQ
jgi:excisionase family DNA binding protein